VTQLSTWDIDGCGCGDIICADGQICVTVSDACTGVKKAGATVAVVRSSDGAAIGSCTTDAAGVCCVTVPGNGTYNVAASVSPCSVARITSVHVDCGETVNRSVGVYCPPKSSCQPFHVMGCNNLALEGATIAITGPVGGSLTTDASGNATFCTETTGTYSYTISHARFADSTGTFTISSLCGSTPGTISQALSPDANHHCCETDCVLPAPYTRYLTTPFGSLAMTWTGSFYCGQGTHSSPDADDGRCQGFKTTADCPWYAAYFCETKQLSVLFMIIPYKYVIESRITINTICQFGQGYCNYQGEQTGGITLTPMTMTSCDPYTATLTGSIPQSYLSFMNGLYTLSD
jgi:hypothetical protein